VEIALLLLAVAFLNAKRSAPPAPHPAAAPAPPPAPHPAAPPAAAVVPLHPGELLTPGATYGATIKLTGIEAMLGTASAVKSKLEAAGFRDVAVADKGGGNFDAHGAWGGAAVPAKLPPQVTAVWRTS
jgi:hypothetical protein